MLDSTHPQAIKAYSPDTQVPKIYIQTESERSETPMIQPRGRNVQLTPPIHDSLANKRCSAQLYVPNNTFWMTFGFLAAQMIPKMLPAAHASSCRAWASFQTSHGILFSFCSCAAASLPSTCTHLHSVRGLGV